MQSQDGHNPFMAGHDGIGSTFGDDSEGMADPLMEDQVGLGGHFLLDHEFPEDYGLDEEDDEVDIEGEPLFEESLPAQANAKKKRKSKRTKAYTQKEDKLLCECWRDIGQDPKIGAEQKASTFWLRMHREFHEHKNCKPYQMESKRGWVSLGKRWRVIQQECNKFCSTLKGIEARPVSGIGMKDMVFQALEAFKVHYEGKSFNLTHCWMIINGAEKFKAQYTAIKAHGGKEAVEEHGEGEKPRPRGKTNFKKEDKREAASLALQATLQGMMDNKESREEKPRQAKEEQIKACMEIQNKKLALEAEKQAKMLEIEATEAATKAREVRLAWMMKGSSS